MATVNLDLTFDLKQLIEGRVSIPGLPQNQNDKVIDSLLKALGVKPIAKQQSVDPEEVKKAQEDKEATEQDFHNLLWQVKSNDPNLTVLNLQYIPMDDERTISLFEALLNNIYVRTISIRNKDSHAKLTDKACKSVSEYLVRTKTLKVLNLCHNMINAEGARHLMQGISQNESLTDICLCNNPMVQDPRAASDFCKVLEQKQQLINGIKNGLIQYVNQRLGQSHPRLMSRSALLEYFTKNTKAFVNIFGNTGCGATHKSKNYPEYNALSECYCVPQLSRFLDSTHAPDYRKEIESIIVDYYCAKFPNKKTVLKFVSIGVGGLIQDAVVIAKLFAAGFKNFNWSLVDIEFNNKVPLLQSKVQDIVPIYQFFCLMQDLGLRVINGNLHERNLVVQDCAFSLFKQKTRPLKSHKGNLCVSSYDSVESYCAAIQRNPKNLPSAILSLDLNDPVTDGIVGPIKKIAADHTLHFNLEKNLRISSGVAQIEVQRKSKGQWKPLIKPERYQTVLLSSDTTESSTSYYSRHRDSYKMTLRQNGVERKIEQEKPSIKDIPKAEVKKSMDKPQGPHVSSQKLGAGSKNTPRMDAATRALARAKAAMDGSSLTKAILYSTAPGESHQIYKTKTIFYSTAPGEDHQIFQELPVAQGPSIERLESLSVCAEVKRKAEELSVQVSQNHSSKDVVDKPIIFSQKVRKASVVGQSQLHKRRNSWSG